MGCGSSKALETNDENKNKNIPNQIKEQEKPNEDLKDNKHQINQNLNNNIIQENMPSSNNNFQNDNQNEIKQDNQNEIGQDNQQFQEQINQFNQQVNDQFNQLNKQMMEMSKQFNVPFNQQNNAQFSQQFDPQQFMNQNSPQQFSLQFNPQQSKDFQNFLQEYQKNGKTVNINININNKPQKSDNNNKDEKNNKEDESKNKKDEKNNNKEDESKNKKDDKNNKEVENNNKNDKKPDDDTIYKAIIAIKSKYPQGKKWNNSNTYEWGRDVAISLGYSSYSGCGCFAFAMIASDAAFGNAPAYKFTDKNKIGVGDILRINNDTHFVIVLKKNGNTKYTIAEGNYNQSINWGRVIDLKETGFDYGYTRYKK